MSLLVDSLLTMPPPPRVGCIGGDVGLLVSSQFKFENISIPVMPILALPGPKVVPYRGTITIVLELGL